MTLTESDMNTLSHGDSAPAYTLLGTDETQHSFPKDSLVLIVFMCNHCPYVIAKLDELNRIAEDFDGKVTVIGINSNNNPNYPQDGFKQMQEMVTDGDIGFTYLFDEDQSVAKSYGATCTPDPFLFSNGKLLFHSRIANPPGTGDIIDFELHDAITEFLESGSISLSEKPSLGCNIKWV